MLVVGAAAQQFASSGWSVKEHEVSFVVEQVRSAAVVTGAPYSADEVQDYTPPDGRSSPRTNVIGHYARDGQGRTRMVRAHKSAPIWLTEIFDPVAGVAYLLDDEKKVAHRMVLPPAPAASGAATNPRATSERLGSKPVEGVMAEGTRMVMPRLTIETWESPELKVTLVTKSSNGYSSYLSNLKRGEPDAELFRAPAGYAVVEEAGGFPMVVRFQ
jgi:hypothetical protein